MGASWEWTPILSPEKLARMVADQTDPVRAGGDSPPTGRRLGGVEAGGKASLRLGACARQARGPALWRSNLPEANASGPSQGAPSPETRHAPPVGRSAAASALG